MIRGLNFLSVAFVVMLCPTFVFAVTGVRLIGITGNQGAKEGTTLYDIDIATKAIQPILRLPFVPDTDSISFNPQNGSLYRASGASSYSNNPASNGFRDNHYMQTVDLLS